MARVVCRRGGAHLRLNRSGCPIPSRTTPCSFGTFDAVVAAPGLVVGPEPVAVVPKCARPVAGCRRAAVLAAAAPPHCGRLYAHLRGVGRLVSWGQCHAHGLPVRRQHKVCTGRGGEGRRSRRTQSLDPGQAELALQNSPATDSDRSQPAVSSHAAGFRSSYSQSQVRLRVDRCMHATAFGG
jgi:hypothetical protein